MDLAFEWVPPACAAVATTVVVTRAAARRRARRAPSGTVPDPPRLAANTTRLTSLPGYRRALARYRVLLAVGCVLLLGLGVGTTLLAARPVGTDTVPAQTSSRDIVLCLDVSNSMAASDVALLDTFARVSAQLTHERIGLVLFASSPVQVFPLTDDYAFVAEQLRAVRDAYDSKNTGFQAWAGTTVGEGTSVIGDGLASCVTSFDRPSDLRPRSIVLATDNVASGPQVFTLEQAATLAAARGVRVYGINSEDPTGDSDAAEDTEYRASVQTTSGEYFPMADATQVPRIVTAIAARESAHFTGAPRLVRTDRPGTVVGAIAMGLLGYLLVMWRVRR